MRRPAPGAALRIARRDALRHRGRSALVIAMIALPVLALTCADVLARTDQLDPAEKISRQLGAADAELRYAGGPVEQDPRGQGWNTTDGGGRQQPPTTAELLRDLPPGSVALPSGLRSARFRTEAGIALGELDGLDYAAPAAAGLVRQLSGRAPRAPDEIALTKPLAASIGMDVGDTVQTRHPDRTYQVVGLVENPYQLDAEIGYTLPAGLPPPAQPKDVYATRWLVDTPAPLSWSDVLELNAKGYIAISRAVYVDPPPRSEVPYYRDQGTATGTDVQTLAGAVLAAGMALLEVVLLAGPAFAVGARRRRRELALLAATGGEQRDVRNVVLAGGLVLGAVAAVVGIGLGIGLAAALLPVLERLSGSVAGHFDVRPLEILGIALVGIVTGLAAALVPARSAARQDVVAALGGRRTAVRTRKRVPIAGAVLTLLGVAIALAAAYLRSVNLILAGAVVAEAGLIMCTPVLLVAAARLGRWLPLSPRLALRDASRNRSSATPAVAAVMAAVAGSVAIGIGVASLSAWDRLNYRPSAPHGDAVVQLGSAAERDQVDEVAAALRETLPTRDVAAVRGLDWTSPEHMVDVGVELPKSHECPMTGPEDRQRYADDPRCRHEPRWGGGYLPNAIVDDGTALPAITGVPATAAVAALRAGKAVVFDPWLLESGRATVVLRTESGDGDPVMSEVRHAVPAVALTDGFAAAQIVLPPAMAERLGVPVQTAAVVAHDSRVPTEEEVQALRGALDRLGVVGGAVVVERGYDDRYQIGLLALLIGATVITLGAAGIATALSNEDGRADLTTLAAVGASPRVRRLLSMSRAGVIAGLGTALGWVAGLVPPSRWCWPSSGSTG